ncbi:hypothetical protein [Streptomyces sp. NPDC005141]
MSDKAVRSVQAAKASGMVCLRVPHDTIDGRRIQQVWNVASTTNAILELGDKLVCQGIERVVMEATGSYWRPRCLGPVRHVRAGHARRDGRR